MLEFVSFVLFLSIVLYIIFAGADFGAGIYEGLCLISGRSSRKELIERAIGPIWEANHIWLILVVVILFMGFPEPFTYIFTYLHIPMAMILIGITMRGTAFAFRHYDPYKDHWQMNYTWIFALSSIWTAFWQGVTVGALLKPFSKDPTHFFEAYVQPWAQIFNFAVGIFVVAVYLFLAQTFFLGEPTDKEIEKSIRKDFIKSLFFVILSGGFVFISSFYQSIPFHQYFFGSTVSIILAITTTLLLFPLWWSYKNYRINFSRIIVGAQVSFIFLAVLLNRLPVFLYFTDGSTLTFEDHAAPHATIKQLFYALVGGVIIIIPFLFYLYKVFKIKTRHSN